MGTQKWLSISEHNNATICVQSLKAQGYKILVSDVSPSSQRLGDVKLASGSKICAVLGTERTGVSQTVKDLADASYYLPMNGFAESYNMSVAAALTVSEFAHRGLLVPSLSEEERQRLLLNWLSKTVLASAHLLHRHGISVGDGATVVCKKQVGNMQRINIQTHFKQPCS
jgi:tRNA (guanosine-2'-O-)-methyltransferase